jgi:hypothetical protein
MNETEVVRELSRRTSLPEATAGAVFDAVRELAREGAIDQDILFASKRVETDTNVKDAALPLVAAEHLPVANHSDPHLVEDLIARARKHPMGLEFLVSGFLASVAIALGAHAFTVEAARERLRKEQKNEAKEPTAS